MGYINKVLTDSLLLSGLENYSAGLFYGKMGLVILTHTRDSSWVSSSKWHHEKARHDMNEVVNYTKKELYERFTDQ